MTDVSVVKIAGLRQHQICVVDKTPVGEMHPVLTVGFNEEDNHNLIDR